MKKRYLLAPGPTPVPDSTLLKMAAPIIHHRAPEFVPVLEDVREGLKYLFQTKNEVITLAASGTGGMEGAVTNLLSKGDKALVVVGGKFGERWRDICNAYGVQTINIDVKWGEAVKAGEVKSHLDANPDIKAVLFQASETSTGVMHPVKEIADLVKERDNTVLIVDAITGLGVFNLPVDEWGLDVVVTGSQKALMLPPGLAFVSLSDKAIKMMETSDLPKYYFDFKKELKGLSKNSTAYTPAVSLMIGLRDVLNQMKEEGLENIFNRHGKLAKATRAAVKALGLNLLAPGSPSDALTAVYAPEGMNAGDIVKLLRVKYGITVAGGQADLKGKIFRIAHLGYSDTFDVVIAISALEMALDELGYSFTKGAGISKAMEILQA
jgi:aspartate aminotransferase-like enzyme